MTLPLVRRSVMERRIAELEAKLLEASSARILAEDRETRLTAELDRTRQDLASERAKHEMALHTIANVGFQTRYGRKMYEGAPGIPENYGTPAESGITHSPIATHARQRQELIQRFIDEAPTQYDQAVQEWEAPH